MKILFNLKYVSRLYKCWKHWLVRLNQNHILLSSIWTSILIIGDIQAIVITFNWNRYEKSGIIRWMNDYHVRFVQQLYLFYLFMYLTMYNMHIHVDNHNRRGMHASTGLEDGWLSRHWQIARTDEVERTRLIILWGELAKLIHYDIKNIYLHMHIHINTHKHTTT